MIGKKHQLLGIGVPEDDAVFSPLQNLFYEINNHTADYLDSEHKFFSEYPQGDNSNLILDGIEQLQNVVDGCFKNGNTCLLKMAAGSGFHSITGNWQYDDFTQTGTDPKTGKKNKKSRKIAIRGKQFYLMGFVKLKILQQ